MIYQENNGNAKGWQTQVSGGTAYIGEITVNHSPHKPATAVKHIPYIGVPHFIGRSEELTKIHEQLHQKNTVVTAITGMGGVGKTELALKYAKVHTDDYPGGICWLNARKSNLAALIVQFAQSYLKLKVSQEDEEKNLLTLTQKVAWCWQNWQPSKGLVLVVLDDITDFKNFSELLPTDHRFRILITTRLRNLDSNIKQISLDMLSPDDALKLLINLISEKRVIKESTTAKELCKRLGYLPLGIELVGRYLREAPDLSLEEMLQRLKTKQLEDESLERERSSLSTAQYGIKDAFELTWQELDSMTQHVGMFLSLFAQDVIPWKFMESGTSPLTPLRGKEKEISQVRNQLFQRHLIQQIEERKDCYKIHPLIREFLQEKFNQLKDKDKILYKESFSANLIKTAREISFLCTLCTKEEEIKSRQDAIPHIAEVAENLIDTVRDEDLDDIFGALINFYSSKDLYTLATNWCEQYVSIARSRLGENHLYYARSLENLAFFYLKGLYKERAETLYQQALELKKKLLGENNLEYALSLFFLADLYKSQGKYDKAEPLYIQALEIDKQLENDCPSLLFKLNQLANLYELQGNYDKAEPLYIYALEITKQRKIEKNYDLYSYLSKLAKIYKLQEKYDKAEAFYIQALEIEKQLLKEDNVFYSRFRFGLLDLAEFYKSQRKYDKAEALYIENLEIAKQKIGENAFGVAESLRYLAALYNHQEKYDKAEPLYIQALDIYKRERAENITVGNVLNSLACIYDSQGKYDKAEPLYIQALKIFELILGKNDSRTIIIRKNLESLQNNFWYKLKKFLS